MFNAIIDFGADVNDIGSVSVMLKDILVSDLYGARTDCDTAVDIGSNVGAFALVASKYARRVISVDASARAIDMQRDMLHHLGMLNVITEHAAVGAHDKCWIQRSMRHVYENVMLADAPSSIYDSVRVFSLPDLFEKFDVVPEVTNMKMNTNGSEVDVCADPVSLELMSRLKSLALVSKVIPMEELEAVGRGFRTYRVDAISDGRLLLTGRNNTGNF